jgi:hypothetical protein
MTRYKRVGGKTIALTAEEEAELNAHEKLTFDAEPAQNLEKLRFERDRLLAETDWWAGSDLTMTQAQADYRQALRDITDNATSLDDVTWPTKP